MAMGQMNVRIDEDLRVRGNLALQAAGYTPSQAVRELWEFAARNRFEPEAVRSGFGCLEKEGVDANGDAFEGRSPFSAPVDAIEEFRKARGIKVEAGSCSSVDDLLYEAYMEKCEERGLL